MADDSFEQRPKAQKRRVFCVVALVLITGFLLAWFAIPPNTNTEPVSFQKDQAGEWHEVGGDGAGSGVNLALHAGKLKSTNNVSMGTVTSHSSPANFLSRSLMILNRSDHNLMQRIGDTLLESLRDRGAFDRIEYFPHGHDPPTGELAPDLYLVLGLGAIEESGLLGRDLKATVRFTLGTAVVRSTHTVSDSFTPPRVRVFSNSSVDHRSTMTGVESSAAEYRLQGADIAKRMSKSIIETLDGLREESFLDCEFPAELNGDWIATPEFSFLKATDAKVMTSLRGLCLHNETTWKMAGVEDVSGLLVRGHADLTEDGWKGKAAKPNDNGRFHLRMKKGAEVLEIFSAHENGGFGNPDATNSAKGSPEIHMGETIFARYRNYMSETERHAVIGKLLDAPTPNLVQLISLNQMGSREQQQSLMQMIEDDPPLMPEAWLMVARRHASQKQTAELEQALRKAYAASWLLDNAEGTARQVKSLCKKHKLKEQDVCKVDSEQIASLGLPTVSRESPFESIIRSGEATAALIGDENEWCVVSVRLGGVSQSGERSFFNTTISEHGPSSRSSMTGG